MRYDAQSRGLILSLKYGDRVELAAALAPMMARAGARLLAEADLLTPVPLHRRRLRARRYNQAALLAGHLASRSKRPVLMDALCRVRPTIPLGTMSAERRHAALEGVFQVRPRRLSAIMGRRVLLIDDVLTSGATCAGCANALLDAGASAVDVLVAARVADPRLR